MIWTWRSCWFVVVVMSDRSLCPDGVVHSQKAMVNIFNNVNAGLTVYHFNARSLNSSKLDYVKFIFEGSTTDIVCVSETWFNNELPNSVYSMHGFQLFRNNRVNKRGGGVAIYCRDGLKVNLINKSNDSLIEFINVEISDNNFKAFVSCVYNPHRQNAIDPYFSDLAVRLVDFDFYIVCGDFNVDILCNVPPTTSLISNSLSTGLHLVNSLVPTRFSNNSTPSLLDILLVSDLNAVVKFDQIAFVSDHDLTFCSFKLPLRCSPISNIFTYRDFNNINTGILVKELSMINWFECYFLASVDDKLKWFMDKIMYVFERNVPLKKAVISSNSSPWFTIAVLEVIRQKNKLHSKWRKNSNTNNWHVYVKARNRANSVIKQAKQAYFASQLNESLSPKQLWSNLNKLKVVPSVNDQCVLQPNLLNMFFTSTSVGDRFTVSSQVSKCDVVNPFQFMAVPDDMVMTAVLSISSNAVGTDGLPIKFLKLCLPIVLSPLTHIINHCYTTSTFPSMWKIAQVTPVPKKTNASLVSDFRPISILPALAKVCERLMADQITKYLTANVLMSPKQSGFRCSHSCTTAMLKILDDIRQPFDNSEITLLCLLDFSKAFDSVNHHLLCNKLENFFHFDKASSSLIASYLNNRFQRVKTCVGVSDMTLLSAGVPQGSTLGPILFTMFINDIFMVCNNVSMHAFADDVQLYLSGSKSNVLELVTILNGELELINQWAFDNYLLLNTSKSKVMPIVNGRFDESIIPTISLAGSALELVSKVRNLGYILNTSLSCSDHINFVTSKIYGILRMLRLSSEFTPVNIRRNLALQLIMPHISYFCVVFSKLDYISLKKLNLLFNNVVRYVYGLRKYDHVTEFSKLLLGVKIVDFLKIHNLIFLHKLLLTKSPGYLSSNLQQCQSNRNNQLILPRYKHLSVSRFFFVNAIRLWNSLPSHLRNPLSATAFRSAIYDYFANSE